MVLMSTNINQDDFLSKEDLLAEFGKFNITPKNLNRLIRIQGLPAKHISSRNTIFYRPDVILWLSRSNKDKARANTTKAKVSAKARKARKTAETPENTIKSVPPVASLSFKAKEA